MQSDKTIDSEQVNKFLFIIYYAVNGDDSMNSGERLRVGSPDGAFSKSAVLSLEIKRVEVTLVDPINSPILSWVSLKGNWHQLPHLLPSRLTNKANKA